MGAFKDVGGYPEAICLALEEVEDYEQQWQQLRQWLAAQHHAGAPFHPTRLWQAYEETTGSMIGCD